MGCVVGLHIYPSETPRLSSEASPRVILSTIARWNFSFARLRSIRIESFGNRLGDLILIQLFCRVEVFLANLESHVAYTKKALTKQPFQHRSQQLWKSHNYQLSSQELVDVWNRNRLSHSHHKNQRCVLVGFWMKMCLLGLAFEWYNHAGLENHYSNCFQQLRRLCLNL